ncbi:MAG TPA: DUF1854 domain-containing protein [Thermoproteales archaeon]|nr:DUF1854 domain-containing protein [Thermoproteales archaeon]
MPSRALQEFIKKLNLVDPRKVKIEYDEKRNALKVTINHIEYYNIIPRKPFPFSRPYFVIFVNKDGEEICMLKDYRELDKCSRKALEKMLSKIYFVPLIKKIKKITYRSGKYTWLVVTDKGEREFEVRGRKSIYHLPDGRIVIFDKYDNVYELRPEKLDKKSLEYLALAL